MKHFVQRIIANNSKIEEKKHSSFQEKTNSTSLPDPIVVRT